MITLFIGEKKAKQLRSFNAYRYLCSIMDSITTLFLYSISLVIPSLVSSLIFKVMPTDSIVHFLFLESFIDSKKWNLCDFFLLSSLVRIAYGSYKMDIETRSECLYFSIHSILLYSLLGDHFVESSFHFDITPFRGIYFCFSYH